MAQLTITVDDAVATRVFASFAKARGWDSTLGMTKRDFCKKELLKFIKDTIKEAELADALETTRNSVVNDVNTLSIT